MAKHSPQILVRKEKATTTTTGVGKLLHILLSHLALGEPQVVFFVFVFCYGTLNKQTSLTQIQQRIQSHKPFCSAKPHTLTASCLSLPCAQSQWPESEIDVENF